MPPRATARVLRRVDRREAMWMTLCWLRQKQAASPGAVDGGVPFPNLRVEFGITGPEVSEDSILRALEDRGLIKRTGPVAPLPYGGGAPFVRLTDTGFEVLDSADENGSDGGSTPPIGF